MICFGRHRGRWLAGSVGRDLGSANSFCPLALWFDPAAHVVPHQAFSAYGPLDALALVGGTITKVPLHAPANVARRPPSVHRFFPAGSCGVVVVRSVKGSMSHHSRVHIISLSSRLFLVYHRHESPRHVLHTDTVPTETFKSADGRGPRAWVPLAA